MPESYLLVFNFQSDEEENQGKKQWHAGKKFPWQKDDPAVEGEGLFEI